MMGKIRGEKIAALGIGIFFLLFFVFFQSSSIFGGDGGDLVSAAYVRGVAHPSGYPLFTSIAYLLTRIPVGTIAWRVAFLSSIPASLTLTILYLILYRITTNQINSFISTTAFGFTYLYWLYAIVPEVFALHLLFAALIIFLSLELKEKFTRNRWYLFVLILSLALAHHQTTVLLLPGTAVFLWSRRRHITRDLIIKSLLISCLGFLPYIYVWLAAGAYPPVNWENPQTINGFFRLISRALYGSFRSSKIFGDTGFSDRIPQLKFFVDTMIIDYTKFGLLLGVLGFGWLYIKKRSLFWLVIINFLVTGPLFLIYAAFPYITNFHLGTIERFFLLPYLFWTMAIACGLVWIVDTVNYLFIYLFKRRVNVPIYLIFSLFPLLLYYTSVPKLSTLKTDQTAEHLGYDILASSPDNAVVLLLEDTEVFNTSYVYLTSGSKAKNRNLKLIQTALLNQPFYQEVLSRLYPELSIPRGQDTDVLVAELIEKNYPRFPIVSSLRVNRPDSLVWIPRGLLFEVKLGTNSASIKDLVDENTRIFSYMYDPLNGALSSYNHPMLSDVRRIYARSYGEFGQTLFALKYYSKAEMYYREAVRILPEISDYHTGLIWSLLLQEKCTNAIEELSNSEKQFVSDPEFIKLNALYARHCLKDPKKEAEFLEKFDQKLKEFQTPLKGF